MRTGVVVDEIYTKHFMGDYHPESPQRLESIYAMLKEPSMAGRFFEVPAREAAHEEIARIHSKGYIERVAATNGKPMVRLDPDTSTSPESYRAALMAAGGLNEAVRRVWEKEIANAFALVRPPGHHAEASRAMGFCLFNNVAVAAAYALDTLGARRVAILDWDLHHGNGTQNSFYDRDDVLYLSTHQFPYYPGSGDFAEVGYGDGEGFTVNVPLSAGYGEGDFVMLFENVFRPVIAEYAPDLFLVSAGFDIYENDPLGAMDVSGRGFGDLARSLLGVADDVCDGRIVFTLEGGYHLGGLTEGVRAVLNEMDTEPSARSAGVPAANNEGRVAGLIESARKVQGRYWKSLA